MLHNFKVYRNYTCSDKALHVSSFCLVNQFHGKHKEEVSDQNKMKKSTAKIEYDRTLSL